MTEKRLVNNGLDLDSAIEVIPNGKYRYALNANVGLNNKLGKALKIYGNSLIPNTLPNGSNRVIGTYEDKVKNHLYFFNWNSNNQHGIYRLELDTLTITTVLVDPLLNFSNDPKYQITHVDMAYLEPDNPVLGWTDGGAPNTSPTVIYNPPRQISVNKAILYTQGDFVNGYSSITVEVLDQIKYPHLFAPTVQMVNDPLVFKNNIRGKLFEFKAQYYYFDFAQSAFSPASKGAYPLGDEVIGNLIVPTNSLNNRIDITIQAGSDICTKIKLYVRQKNSTNNNWYLVDTIDNPPNPTVTYQFFNDKTLVVADILEANKLYDYVPRVSQTETVIAGNRRVWGNVIDQFDLPTIDATFTPIYEALPAFNTAFAVGQSTTTVAGNTVKTMTFGPPIPIFGVSVYYPVGTILDFGDTYGQLVVTDVMVVDFPTFLTAVGDYLVSQGALSYVIGVSITPPLTQNQIQVTSNGIVNYTVTSANSIPKANTFKSGAVHPFAIVYYDRANRSGTSCQTPACSVYVLSRGQQVSTISPIGIFFAYQVKMGWAINHVPPIWATHYQIVYGGNSTISNVLQFTIRSYTAGTTQDTISIETLKEFNQSYLNSVLSYTYTAGDRLRLVTWQGTAPSYVDVSINGYNESTFTLTIEALDSAINLAAGNIIEIYTPKNQLSDDQIIYYEIGEEYEIGDAGLSTRYHKGQTQDQIVGTQPATGVIKGGDTWYKLRQMPTTNSTTLNVAWVEGFNYSDFYNSSVWNKGRPNRYDPDFKETSRPTTIYFSQPFIPETNINGLGSVFDTNFGSDDILISLNYGGIKRLYSEGEYLDCFQEGRVGTIGIFQRLTRDPAGGNISVVTDRVLNPIRYYLDDVGIRNSPECFAVFRNGRYFADTLRGLVCRLSIDGITPISTLYKLQSFTAEKFSQIEASPTKIQMWGVFDRRRQEFIYAPQNSGDFVGYTLGFSEPLNAFTSFYSYEPECMGTLGTDIVTFKNGECYYHGINSPKANFYGVQYPFEISVPSNQTPSEVKVWMATSLEASRAADAPEITTSLGQSSNLILQDYQTNEGEHYAAFLFDTNTPNVPNPLINGDSLRGYWLLMKIQDNAVGDYELFSVNFSFNYSPPNVL